MESPNVQHPPIYHLDQADSETLLLRNLYLSARNSVYLESYQEPPTPSPPNTPWEMLFSW